MEEIITMLKDYMKRNGLTQAELAVLLGCSQSAVSRWMRGERNILGTYLLKFYKLLEQEKERDAECRKS